MSETPQNSNLESETEKGEANFSTLEEFLSFLDKEGITTFSPEEIRRQLDNTGVATITQDFGCGIRISKHSSHAKRKEGDSYIIWTTNGLEDYEHPLTKKIRLKKITV